LLGGCDWLDAKDPESGSLGQPNATLLRSIAAIPRGSIPLSTAGGEWEEIDRVNWLKTVSQIPELTFTKVGLSHCRRSDRWRDDLRVWSQQLPANLKLVPVFYADEINAESPTWQDVFEFAKQLQATFVLIDTFLKDGRTLIDYIDLEQLAEYRACLSSEGIQLVCAGSLKLKDLECLISQVHPALVAVRGAACESGRNSKISVERVQELKKIVLQASS
jgi:uncharacterized protein (UPF0264 family)